MSNNEFMVYRNETLKEKIPTYYEIMPKDLYLSMNNPNISESKKINYFNNTYNNNLRFKGKINKENQYISPININYYDNKNRNKIQINQDIIGYNNLIINNNNYDSIDVNKNKKRKNFNFYNTKNPKKIGIKNYITISRINNKCKDNKKINSTSINNANNNKNNNNSNKYNSSFYQNEEIKYMNMRLNFKLLEQKIENLNNMVLGESLSSPRKNFNQTLDNMYNYKNKINNNISNSINVNRFESTNKNEIPYNKGLKKFLSMSNTNNLEFKNVNKIPINIKKRVKRISIKKKYLENKKKENKRYIKSLDSNYSKSDSEISEIADDIIDILKENIHKNKKASDKEINSFIITNNNSINNDINNDNNNNITKTLDISKIKIKMNKSKNLSISNPTELFYNPENKNKNQNQNKNDKSDKKPELSIEHVFTYNHTDNIDNNKKQIDTNKSNDDIKDNKQLLKFLLNDKDFIRKKLQQEIELMKLLKQNIKNEKQNNKNLNNKKDDNNNDKNNNDNDDNEKDEDGEKVINSLVSQIARSNQENNGNNFSNSSRRESNNNDNDFNLPLKRNLSNYFIFEKREEDNIHNNNKKKKVTFDDKLIFINYNGKEKVPNLHVSDSNNKNIKFKKRDISKYLYILSSKTIKNNIKPIILNVNKIDYKNIINKIKINKSNNIIRRNIDSIKLMQKMNFSKEKYKAKIDLKSERISRKYKAQSPTSKRNITNSSKSKKDKKKSPNSHNNKK